MTIGTDLDLPRLLHIAGGILDGVSAEFVAGLGAPSAVSKGRTDFATQVDLDLERRISAELADRTGIAVHGEEFGGPPVDEGVVWVLDPVDGTFNYSAGIPFTGILLALLVEGRSVLGLTWMPLSGQRFAGHVDGPLLCNGEPALVQPPARLSEAAIAFGAFNAAHGGRYAGARRADLLRALSGRVARVRMTGSTGADMAYAACGAFGAAIAFGRHPWDNAAGAALVAAAGGVATDLAGNPWTVTSPSLVAGAPGIHREVMAVIDEVIDGDWSGRDDLDEEEQTR
ncbi:inositol monophosphatase [Gordonia desulfuricans]|uniref:inositol-phosphate phosphatase n=1 Tax=Gordonia desulfuricans TaxID=89051 RepID=A0A7K3LNG3_9ACTN|nr:MULTISPECIES: inositol monophosphatase [Gordonia]EMP12083.2 inositol monophosphatase [Gordonia sp. NB41Y]NDK89790.1 inositol monophosphatase [Gordonia desulfuricans]WLP90463.1 inositol monophosphatase [Gordonia sp. NB41Y]